MEFHAGAHSAGTVDVMVCSDTMCRQLKISVTAEEEKKHGEELGRRVEQQMANAFARLGEAALQIKSLAALEEAASTE